MKVITNSSGKMETVNHDDTEIYRKLANTKRELRAMIAGSIQFHKDEFSPKNIEPLYENGCIDPDIFNSLSDKIPNINSIRSVHVRLYHVTSSFNNSLKFWDGENWVNV